MYHDCGLPHPSLYFPKAVAPFETKKKRKKEKKERLLADV